MSLTAYDICQQESVDFLASRFHAACGDAPGLGKTRTARKAAQKVGARIVLIVTLGSPRVRRQWQEEFSRANYPTATRVDIISFNGTLDPETLRYLLEHYDVVIVDEAHRCKDLDSKWTRAVLGKDGLAARGTYKWLLSGTFKPNHRPVEMYPALRALCPHFDMSFAKYAQRYCGAYFDGRAMRNNGASNVEEWNRLVADFMISHTKRQAFPGRQAPVVVPVAVDLPAGALAEVLAEERKIISRDAHISTRMEEFSQLGDSATLRRLTGRAMIEEVLEFAEIKLETNEKVAVFFQHTEVGEAIFRSLTGRRYACAWFAGGMSGAQQEAAIAAFKTSARVLVAQQQAIGSGVDGLQGATDTLIFAEPDWTPGETEQRVNRFDRIGTQFDLITAYVLYARGTLGAAVWGVHSRKEAVGRRAGWV